LGKNCTKNGANWVKMGKIAPTLHQHCTKNGANWVKMGKIA
jgi:hypothetical protein